MTDALINRIWSMKNTPPYACNLSTAGVDYSHLLLITWLFVVNSIAIYRYLSLSSAISHYLWLSLAISRYLSLSIAISRYLWLFLAIYRYLSLSLAISTISVAISRIFFFSIYLSIYLCYLHMYLRC